MRGTVFDFEDGSFLFPFSDNMAMSPDGGMMMRLSNNMALDTESGEVHMTSPWPEDDCEDDSGW